MVRLMLIWDEYTGTGTVRNSYYPEPTSFRGRHLRPQLNFSYDSLQYADGFEGRNNFFTDLGDVKHELSYDQILSVRGVASSLKLKDDEIIKESAESIERSIRFYTEIEIKSITPVIDLNIDQNDTAILSAYRDDLYNIMNDTTLFETLVISDDIVNVIVKYGLDDTYAKKKNDRVDDIKTAYVGTLHKRLYAEIASESAKIREYTEYKKDQLDIFYDDKKRELAEVVDSVRRAMNEIVQREQEVGIVWHNRRIKLIDEILSQAGVDKADMTDDDKLIIDDFIEYGYATEKLAGDYGIVPDGRKIYECVNLDPSNNELKEVLYAHMIHGRTFFDVDAAEFKALPPIDVVGILDKITKHKKDSK